MKKLNTYLMGMMSVAVCLFSVACSSDDEETAPKEDGIVTVEAVFANDGLTRAAIGGDGTAARSMTFDEDDVLRLVGNSKTAAEGRVYDFTASIPSGTKIVFRGQILNGTTFENYTAYLISSTSQWKSSGTPSMSSGTVGTVCSSLNALDEAFKLDAVISGTYNTTNNEYELSLENAFVINTSGSEKTFYYGTDSSVKLKNGEAVAVGAGTVLRDQTDAKAVGVKTKEVADNTIYKFQD